MSLPRRILGALAATPLASRLRQATRAARRAWSGDSAAAPAPQAEGWPAGHFYSPVPSLEQVRRDEARIFADPPPTLPAIDLNEAGQLALLDAIAPFYPEQPFPERRQPGARFWFENDYYSYGEALVLYGLMRLLRPRRIVEIGSGFSSAAILDTADRFLGGDVACTFVEPHPERLHSLLTEADRRRAEIVERPVQELPTAVIERLGPGDILFVDSTHVSKIDSDVNHIVFRLLPAVAPGVWVHFHDVYYPFEYPKEWVYQGRFWNEAYLLRAVLQWSSAFEIAWFGSFMHRFHQDRLAAAMPLVLRSPGSSLWLRKR